MENKNCSKKIQAVRKAPQGRKILSQDTKGITHQGKSDRFDYVKI